MVLHLSFNIFLNNYLNVCTGAVIAREYGLPCIVGAMHATEMFSTGETVRLSGTEGFIEKVSIAEEKDESQ